MMKKYGVKYPHQANKCFLLLLPDEHECEMGGQQQPSTQTISRNHYACRDVRFFLSKLYSSFSPTAAGKAVQFFDDCFVVSWAWGFCGFAVFARNYLLIHRPSIGQKPQKASQLNGFECLL